MHPSPRAQRGFTLIELSIVLVIIGLIVGGVVVAPVLAEDALAPAPIAADHENHGPRPQEWDASGRCDAKAKAFWKGLLPEERQSLKNFIAANPYIAAVLPEAISALEAGKVSQAQGIVQEHYGVDGKLAANITALMAYANGIESACPADEKSGPQGKGETHGAK